MSEMRRLEEPVRLSESVLWSLQRRFFDALGPEAWARSIVPSHVSSNPLVARRYAASIAGFWRDLLAADRDGPLGSLDPTKPLYVIELGSGLGRLGHGLVQALAEQAAAFPVPIQPVVVVSDVVEGNVTAMLGHERFEEHVAAGRADGVLLDLDAPPGSLSLRASGRTLDADPDGNPIVVVANYVLDGVKQDLYRVKDGRLLESLVAVHVPEDAGEDDPRLVEKAELRFRDRPAPERPYDDPDLDALVAAYTDGIGDGGVLIPVGALRWLRQLRAIGGGRLLVLAGDKALRRLHEWRGLNRPYLARHGSVSVMANLHAVAWLAERHGGRAWHEPTAETRFAVTAALTPRSPGPLPLGHFQLAWREGFELLGPATYHRLYRGVREVANPPLGLVLALLQLSDGDVIAFGRYADRLREAAGEATEAEKTDLVDVLGLVWSRRFPAPGVADEVAFRIGRILYRAGRDVDAAMYFERALADDGEHRATWYNLALCYERTQRLPEAIAALERAVALDPGYDRAVERLKHLRGLAATSGG